jgi:uncharacterized repeat protein (TIGR01451 family)
MARRISHSLSLLAFATSIILSALASPAFTQNDPNRESLIPDVELLALSGSKPNLAPNGEGITSIKISDLYKLGATTVKADSSFPIELPAGYTLFNKLSYVMETEAVYSGPNDFTFKVPTAVTRESFDKLRILIAEYDQAEPQKPRWTDVTLLPESFEEWQQYLPKTEFEKRLPSFESRSLHGFTFERPVVLIVATKDSSIARDNFVADLDLTAKPEPEQVMEGRDIKFTFTITNKGPHSATSVSFASYVDPEMVTINQSQGVCRWEAHNIYCNLGEILKDASATITFHGQSSWNFFNDDQPSKSGGMDATPLVRAAEADPDYGNNQISVGASVVKDPNKPPIVSITSPSQDQLFVGPEPDVKIVINAYDPDGAISELQIYNENQLLGSPKLTGKNTYEFVYPKVRYGPHFLYASVKDNLGRPGDTPLVNFFVNGQARVEIVSPQPNQIIIGPVEELVVKVRASDPARQLTKVTVHNGGIEQQADPTGQKDEYAATFKGIGPGRLTLSVEVVDDAGSITFTHPIESKITEPPHLELNYVEGEYKKAIHNGTVLPASTALKFSVHVTWHAAGLDSPAVTKLEVFANGKSVCVYADSNRKKPTTHGLDIIECSYKLAPGKYTLSATVNDNEGTTGKSEPIEVVVR